MPYFGYEQARSLTPAEQDMIKVLLRDAGPFPTLDFIASYLAQRAVDRKAGVDLYKKLVGIAHMAQRLEVKP
jgi:hypothetical protein